MYIYAVLCLHVHMDVEYSFLFCCCCKYCTYARGMWIICLIRYTWKLWPACTLRNFALRKNSFIHNWCKSPEIKKCKFFLLIMIESIALFFSNSVALMQFKWRPCLLRTSQLYNILCNCWIVSRIDFDWGMKHIVLGFLRLHMHTICLFQLTLPHTQKKLSNLVSTVVSPKI